VPVFQLIDGANATQAVMHLMTPLQHLRSITSVAELFRDAEDARKVVQEKVAGEMDTLYASSKNWSVKSG
jgi:hypothetical protein